MRALTVILEPDFGSLVVDAQNRAAAIARELR
jgi:hypothetical protein